MQCEVVYNGKVIFWKRFDSVCHAYPYLCSLPAGGKSTSKERVRRYIKGLLELAHSCYGLSLHCFLGLAEFRYSWIRFMWTFKTFEIYLLLLLSSFVIRKLVYSSWWKLEKKGCVGWRWGGQRSLDRQCPFCWCVCLWGSGWAGWG